MVGGAALLGGLGWLLLLPAAELERRNLLSYDGYNRFLAVPLLLFPDLIRSLGEEIPSQVRRAIMMGSSCSLDGTRCVLVVLG